jgi:cysteine desulfurase/selenocysteine lyase
MNDLQRRVAQFRQDFPILANNDLVYLDNSATTQRPIQVLEAEKTFYETKNANPFRGVYELSEACTQAYEAARTAVAQFIHAKEPAEIIFTRNASESLNLVAYSYGMEFLKPGDEIVVSVMEHHSNFLPWKMVAERTGATLVKLEPTLEGELTDEILDSVLNEHTKLVALTQVSNVLGRVNDLKHIAQKVHAVGAVLVADGAQSVPHMPVDVTDLDVDFLAFSGHKMLAPTGVGVLYGKRALLEKMPPFLRGGEMIEIVHWDRVKYASLPHKFEAGTVNTGGVVALHAAIDYLNHVGFDTIHAQEAHLTQLAFDGMKDLPNIHIYGGTTAQDHCGILTFGIDGVHPHDIATIFDQDHICVRAGHHCAQPLMDFLGVFSTTRASFAFYNTEEDVERFLNTLSQIRRKMGYAE